MLVSGYLFSRSVASDEPVLLLDSPVVPASDGLRKRDVADEPYCLPLDVVGVALAPRPAPLPRVREYDDPAGAPLRLLLLSRACALLANRGPMSVRAVESFGADAPAADALGVGLVRASGASDSDESDSSDELLSLSLFSDPLEASAVGVPARPKKRLWKRCGAAPFVEADAVEGAAVERLAGVAVDADGFTLPKRLLVVVVAIVADADSPLWLPVLERRPVEPDWKRFFSSEALNAAPVLRTGDE